MSSTSDSTGIRRRITVTSRAVKPPGRSVEALKLLGRLPVERNGSSSTSVMPSCCISRMIGKSNTASGPSSRRRISGAPSWIAFIGLSR
jgi:hypothetical protein